MKAYAIIITPAAEKDIDDICDYVAENDSLEKANDLSITLEEKCLSLTLFPERGRPIDAAAKFGLSGFYELHYHAYKIIYRVFKNTVMVYGLFDNRRSLDQLLLKRLSYATRFYSTT
ncbi:MAG TPA: type II toxin-antitoxin system RelE/ParE family toxin [Gammaproteobacteria bacterium]|nr:type II toxin-antitoxin system RelE/ParE family toxin [Gammaproteobacteria bacterium]